MPEYEAKNSKKATADRLKIQPKNAKKKHSTNQNMPWILTCQRCLRSLHRMPPHKYKNRSRIPSENLCNKNANNTNATMQTSCMRYSFKTNLFSIFWLLDKAISASKCKSQYSIIKMFLLFLVVVCKALWKSTKSNVCPHCCTSLCCALCNYSVDSKKKKKKK